ncbi:MAG TPA: carboxypeptidase regulatory-like domain-containing protein [Bryobacteraceae bacterium]|nr:carboxypeptidase regulatory-like domain-containing protein [Bryobacteraceae bacterium]
MRCGLLLFCSAICLSAQTDPSTPEKGLLAGKVLNSATGEPVRKARVALFELSGKPQSKRRQWDDGGGLTDAAGRFEFTGLAPGKYRLVAAREGFATPDQHSGLDIVLAADQEKRDAVLRLDPLGVITGRILDEDGDPIRQIEVQMMSYQYTAAGRQLSARASATSDDRGEYRLYDVKPGKYYLKAGTMGMMNGSRDAYAASYYPGTPDAAAASAIEVSPGQVLQGIDVTLHATRLAVIRGRVINPGSEMSVGLTMVQEGGGSGTVTTSIDDAKGKFELRGVSPGSYTVIAHGAIAGQPCSAHLPVQVGGADLEGIELRLLPPMDVSGQLRVEGKTAAKTPRLHVILEGEGRRAQSRPGEGREDGPFVFQGLEPGLYQVSVNAPPDLYLKVVRWSDRDITQTGLDLTQGAAGGELVVVMSANGGQIAGVVEGEQSALPPGAVVALVPDAAHKKTATKLEPVGRDGHFRIQAIAPGTYKLFAFEDADPNQVMYDPDFLRPFESQGQSIEIAEGGKESVQLKIIRR